MNARLLIAILIIIAAALFFGGCNTLPAPPVTDLTPPNAAAGASVLTIERRGNVVYIYHKG